MPLQLTEAQLDAIAARIFVLRDPFLTILTEPRSSTGAASLDAALSAFDIPTRYPNVGIGVVYFPPFPDPPRYWLHNPGAVWRIASTSKLAILLAAVQLREDVRAIQKLDILRSPAEYDELFAMKKLWARSSDARAIQIAGRQHAPRVSTILDFPPGGAPAEFFGGDTTALVGNAIFGKFPAMDSHVTWQSAKNFEFSERLWLIGALSDNVAATSCVSQLGVAYVKAVQRAYGLFRPIPSGMRMLMGFGEYTRLDPRARVNTRSNERFRPLLDRETQRVRDVWRDRTGQLGDHDSWEGGTAAALLALLTAMATDSLAPADFSKPDSGTAACQSMIAALGNGSMGIQGLLAAGLPSARTIVTLECSKIGLLGRLAADFAYVKTTNRVWSPAGEVEKKMTFGMVATNLLNDGVEARTLGTRIHDALLMI